MTARTRTTRTYASPYLRRLLLVVVLSSISLSRLISANGDASYANVTLSNGNDLSVVVFLPSGLKPSEKAFYYASRFEHGSMIGLIRRKTTAEKHWLFEADMWRVPHNSNWPESGVGLASEFGVGDDGAFCYYRCGWNSANDVTNGVLGYGEAKVGEPFLKIGVGKLLKGTCPTCDSTEDYRFNSPYLFAEQPVWLISKMSEQTITLTHEATLEGNNRNAGAIWGYRLVKDISLADNLLSVTSTLTNLGNAAFSTAWYSHNFFTCDGLAVGPGYELDLDIQGGGTRTNVYDEPGTWSWSTPISEYAKVKLNELQIKISLFRAMQPGVRIKTEFSNDFATSGGYTIRACDTELQSTLERSDPIQTSMYAYSLYLERGTLSPEPQILLHLEPQQSTSWTQRLRIRGLETETPVMMATTKAEAEAEAQVFETAADASSLLGPSSSSSWSFRNLSNHSPPLPWPLLAIVVAMCCWISIQLYRQRRRTTGAIGKGGGNLLSFLWHDHRQSYALIPDHDPLSQGES